MSIVEMLEEALKTAKKERDEALKPYNLRINAIKVALDKAMTFEEESSNINEGFKEVKMLDDIKTDCEKNEEVELSFDPEIIKK